GDAGAEAPVLRRAAGDGGREQAGPRSADPANGGPLARRDALAGDAELATHAVRDSPPAVGPVLTLRFEPGRREHADYGQERRREDLYGPTVPPDDGASQPAHLHFGTW